MKRTVAIVSLLLASGAVLGVAYAFAVSTRVGLLTLVIAPLVVGWYLSPRIEDWRRRRIGC